MKSGLQNNPMNTIQLLAAILGAGAGYQIIAQLGLPTDTQLVGIFIGALAGFFLTSSDTDHNAVMELEGFKWGLDDFCRGWLITGKTGAGKTAGGICRLMAALCEKVPNWGGLCVDQKGLFWEILQAIFASFGRKDDVLLLQVRPAYAPPAWTPQYRFNLIGNSEIPAMLFAQSIIDVGASVGVISTEGSSSHFATQARIHMAKAIDAYRCTDTRPTLKNVYEMLMMPSRMEGVLAQLKAIGTQPAADAYNHFNSVWANIADEELSGIKGTITNVLSPFTQPAIAEVFCPDTDSFSMAEMDKGKVICVSVPQHFQTERTFINTFLKLHFYIHALRRFDKPAAARKKDNLLIFWADEAQRIITKAEHGLGDQNCIDQTREAKVTVVFATQSTTSLIPPLKEEKNADVLLLNLSNRLYFTLSDEKAAEAAAKHLGKHRFFQRSSMTSSTRGGPSVSRQLKDEFLIRPEQLRAMKKFECIIYHCERGFKRSKLLPTPFTKPSVQDKEPSKT